MIQHLRVNKQPLACLGKLFTLSQYIILLPANPIKMFLRCSHHSHFQAAFCSVIIACAPLQYICTLHAYIHYITRLICAVLYFHNILVNFTYYPMWNPVSWTRNYNPESHPSIPTIPCIFYYLVCFPSVYCLCLYSYLLLLSFPMKFVLSILDWINLSSLGLQSDWKIGLVQGRSESTCCMLVLTGTYDEWLWIRPTGQ